MSDEKQDKPNVVFDLISHDLNIRDGEGAIVNLPKHDGAYTYYFVISSSPVAP